MDDLPPSARELLALARNADRPSAETRERVRHGVALALAAGAAGAALSASAVASASSTPRIVLTAWSKLLFVSGAIAALCATALVLHGSRAGSSGSAAPAPHVAPAARVPPAPTQADQPAQRALQPSAAADARLPIVHAPAPALPAAHPQALEPRTTHATTPSSSSDPRSDPRIDLRGEMQLLASAVDALDHHDLAGARTFLDAHRARYPHAQLLEERRSLTLIAHCLAGDAGATEHARRYLARATAGVLGSRLERACGLQVAP